MCRWHIQKSIYLSRQSQRLIRLLLKPVRWGPLKHQRTFWCYIKWQRNWRVTKESLNFNCWVTFWVRRWNASSMLLTSCSLPLCRRLVQTALLSTWSKFIYILVVQLWFLQVVNHLIFECRYLSKQYPNLKLKFLCPNRTASILSLEERITYCSARFREVISQCSNSYIVAPMNIR